MKLIRLVMLTLCLFLPISSFGAEANTEKTKPEPLPQLQLIVPDNEFYQSYLGLRGKPGEPFTLEDIDADILLIELFSMYCPYCQKEAPLINELYEKMEELSDTGVIVKIIGFGASNSQFEVEHFRDTYNVPFPLFPDKNMAMYNALKGKGTPGFIGARLRGISEPTIVLRNAGGFYSSDDFLKDLVERAQL